MTAAPASAPAVGAARHAARRNAKQRRFVTPEGIDLQLEIASAGLRFGALVIDLTLMLVILTIVTLILVYGTPDGAGQATLALWLVGFFLLRNFWFIAFELGPRAATPGKRLTGIRVVARDGGRLTVSSVVARNLVREMEMFLPFAFLAGSARQDLVSTATVLFALAWTLILSCFLLFNRDRMRLGDLIGGTWVVLARRSKMQADIGTPAAQAGAEEPLFTPAELAVYGVYELQELERVLRQGDAALRRTVADTIRAKIGRPMMGDDDIFLSAYYRQLKARLERDLLFGKRRANKYEAPQ
jgi:uncharacterized RDD family membrane protein YckC